MTTCYRPKWCFSWNYARFSCEYCGKVKALSNTSPHFCNYCAGKFTVIAFAHECNWCHHECNWCHHKSVVTNIHVCVIRFYIYQGWPHLCQLLSKLCFVCTAERWASYNCKWVVACVCLAQRHHLGNRNHDVITSEIMIFFCIFSDDYSSKFYNMNARI